MAGSRVASAFWDQGQDRQVLKKKSLQNFKNQWNVTGTLVICAAWRYVVSTTSRSPSIAPVQAGKFFAQYMPWLEPIQLSWIQWTLKSHFFATVMLLITTHHITRYSHQNVCSGSRMLRTLEKELLLGSNQHVSFVIFAIPLFWKKNLQPKKKNNIKKTQSRINPPKKITLYE